MLAQFTSKVGFAPGTTSPDGVTVALGYFDDMGSLVFFNKMPVMSDGQMHDYNVDLSSMAGKHTQFVLWVQANGSPEGTCVRWEAPKITQKAQPIDVAGIAGSITRAGLKAPPFLFAAYCE